MCTNYDTMKKLAVIGASYLQLPVVKKAKEMGIEVHCFAWREGAVCADVADYFYDISTIDKEAILKECQRIGIDGIVTIASDVAVLTVNYVATHMQLPGNDDSYSEVVTNKFRMRECFLQSAIPSPRFCLVKEGQGFDAAKAFRFPVIVKPTDRSGSRGVEKVLTIDQLPEAIDRAMNESFAHEAIVEEFVEGREISVECISWQGQHHLLQITDKVTTGEPYFVELEHHQPTTLPADIVGKIKTIVPQALDALHIRYGASHSEIKITPDGELFFIEIGARMGGDFIGSDLVRLSTGYDFLQGVIEVALGEFHEPQLTSGHYSGVYFLSAETAWLQPMIEHAADMPEVVEAEITDATLRHIESSSDRSGYLIYQSTKGRLSLR